MGPNWLALHVTESYQQVRSDRRAARHYLVNPRDSVRTPGFHSKKFPILYRTAPLVPTPPRSQNPIANPSSPRDAAAMAEPALLDLSAFDLRHYPAHLFHPDLPIAGGGLPLGEFSGDDLDFDLPADFSVDDFLLRSPDRGDDDDNSGKGSAARSGPVPSSLWSSRQQTLRCCSRSTQQQPQQRLHEVHTYRYGTPCVGVLALHAQLGLWSLTERRRQLGFHVVACMTRVYRASSPTSLFIEHVNELCHHRPISTLIRL
jgi:hypothetical protein